MSRLHGYILIAVMAIGISIIVSPEQIENGEGHKSVGAISFETRSFKVKDMDDMKNGYIEP